MKFMFIWILYCMICLHHCPNVSSNVLIYNYNNSQISTKTLMKIVTSLINAQLNNVCINSFITDMLMNECSFITYMLNEFYQKSIFDIHFFSIYFFVKFSCSFHTFSLNLKKGRICSKKTYRRQLTHIKVRIKKRFNFTS